MSNPAPLNPLGLAFEPFRDAIRADGFGPGHAAAAYRAVFRTGDPAPKAHRGRTVCEAWIPPIVREHSEEVSEGTTIKFVQRLDRASPQSARLPASNRAADKNHLGVLAGDDRVQHLDIESVIIPMVGRTGTRTHTLCVSSQVGCAMGCGFCETAQMGLVRSLSAEEIVAQWWAATHIKKAPIDNIVFMGMGEPLDNIDEVIRAITVLTDHQGAAVPMSRITISTVGRIDGLRRLREVVKQHGWKRLGLAVSINAPNDAIRSEIMPINRSMPMAELRAILVDLQRGSNRKLCFEYVLIPGVNDAREHARELAAYLEPFKAAPGRSAQGLVNVIPYNPRRDSPWPAPEEARVDEFMGWLTDEGLFVKRRRTKGRSQMAACGQLGTAEIRKRRYTPLTVDA